MTKYRIAYAKIQTTTTLDGVETLHEPSWYTVLFADDKRLNGYNSTVERDQSRALRSLAHLLVSLAAVDAIEVTADDGTIDRVRLVDLPAEIQPLIQERLADLHPTVRAKIAEREKASP